MAANRAPALVEALQADKDSDLRICGVFDDRSDDRSPLVVGGIPKLGNVDDLVEFTRLTRVDLILVSLPLTAEDRVLEMVRKLWVLPVDIRLAAHMNQLRFRPRAYSYIGNVPVLDIFDKPIADWNMVLKAVFDRVVGAMALLLLGPIMAMIAIAVKLDSKGPVLFPSAALRLQQRTDRRPEVPFALSRQGGRCCENTGDQGRSTRDARRTHHPQDQPRRACPNCSTSYSRAICHSSAHVPTHSTHAPSNASTKKPSTAISRAIASSPA